MEVAPTGRPGSGSGSAGACPWLCCCFSSSICCRVKKGRRRQGGSSGCLCAHSWKQSAWRHCTCSRRFFLCLVVKWQNSQAKGFPPAGHCAQRGAAAAPPRGGPGPGGCSHPCA